MKRFLKCICLLLSLVMLLSIPPHAGLAFGLDRVTMLLTGTDNIRDVIAFPKTTAASCLMTDAPNLANDDALTELAIAVTDIEK